MFFVYEHIRNDKNVPFYVGKGKDNRATSIRNRNIYWKRVVEKSGGYTVNYLAKDMDEELAYLCEQERIDQLKKLGYELTNLTIGGEGASGGELHHMYGKIHPQKGIKRPWLSDRYKGEKNPMFGKPSAMRGVSKPKGKDSPLYGRKRPEGGGKPSRPVICSNGMEFKSVADAARYIGCAGSPISKCCQGKSKTVHNLKWAYKEKT